MSRKPVAQQYIRNDNPGAGYMYFIRYSPQRIEAHRDQVISAISEIGAKIVKRDDEVHVVIRVSREEFGESNSRRLGCLLEELSILNESANYHDQNSPDLSSLSSLAEMVDLTYTTLINNDQKINAFNYVTRTIPGIIRELKVADQNDCLYGHERKTLDDLQSFCENKARGFREEDPNFGRLVFLYDALRGMS